MSGRWRVAFLTSHPIQYQAPLFRALARRREVDLTVLFGSDQGVREYRDEGFATQVKWDTPLLEGYRHVFLRNLNPLRHGPVFWRLVNPGVVGVLRAGRFDALIVHGWAYATSWLAFIAAHRLGIPVLLRGESNALREPGGLRAVVRRRLLGWLFERTAAFLAIGSLNRAFYRRYGVPDDRIFQAPYAVDNGFFRTAADRHLRSRRHLRCQEGIPEDACVFMFCGKLTAPKRPLDLVDAVARIPPELPVYLLYVGDGPLRRQVEERARPLGNVRVTGFRNQSELPRYYAMADVLVLPSEFEPWGLVVNEALSCGLDVIASDRVGAAPDLVRPGATGDVVAVGDVARLASVMSGYARCPRPRPSRASLDAVDAWDLSASVEGIVAAVAATAGRRA